MKGLSHVNLESGGPEGMAQSTIHATVAAVASALFVDLHKGLMHHLVHKEFVITNITSSHS